MTLVLTDNRTIELYSPDGLHSLILRAGSTAQSQAWVSGLSNSLADSTEMALNKVNRLLQEVLEGNARYMGWLLKRSVSDCSANNSIKVSSYDWNFSELSFKNLPTGYCLHRM